MTVEREYWNIPKADELLSIPQSTNLTVFVDHAAKSTYLGLEVTEWTALCSLLVAAISIYVARKANELTKSEAKANREHNQLSIRPHLITSSSLLDEGKTFTIFIENCGLGPAVINDYFLKIDDVVIVSNGYFTGSDLQKEITDLLLKLISKKINYFDNSTTAQVMTLPRLTTLQAGVSFKVIELKLDRSISNDTYDYVMANINQRIKYSDFYGNCFINDNT